MALDVELFKAEMMMADSAACLLRRAAVEPRRGGCSERLVCERTANKIYTGDTLARVPL